MPHRPTTNQLVPHREPARRPISVLVVDDSAYMRHAIGTRALDAPDVRVIDTARDGEEALAKIKALRPDIVTLDVEMPTLDGLRALRRIMQEAPTRVIMLSSRTTDGAATTVEALRLGALDFVAKPNGDSALDLGTVRDELLTKIRRLVSAPAPRPILHQARPAPVALDAVDAIRLGSADKLLIIGTSTGGPRALGEMVPMLPANLDAAILIVQHMPAGFTRPLAQRLNTLAQVMVKEAQAGDPLRQGLALVAPGDSHLVVQDDNRVGLTKTDRVHGVRPAVDVTLVSACRRFGRRTVAVILTGMGVDGCAGALAIRDAGGKVIAEDESTAAIYGMPRAVVEAGAADRLVPLSQVAAEAVQFLRGL
jgi:two-component system chemotaxis response regulator CheB